MAFVHKFLILTLIVGLQSTSANAERIRWTEAQGGNGNYYEIILLPDGRPRNRDFYLNMATDDVQSFTVHGRQVDQVGKLATIESIQESNFLLQAFFANPATVPNTYAFLGTRRQPGANMTFRNGESVNSPDTVFTNWLNGTPTPLVPGTSATSLYAAMIIKGTNSGKWVTSNFIPPERFAAIIEYDMPTSVPTPSTFAGMTIGLGALGFVAHRRRKDRNKNITTA